MSLGAGPNGGDGGRGGDVVLVGDVNTNNLVDYKYQPHWKGERGEHGQGADCHGRDGKPCIMKMPLGTVVIDLATGKPVAEIDRGRTADRPLQRRQRRLGKHAFQDVDQSRAQSAPTPGIRANGEPTGWCSRASRMWGSSGFPNAGKSSLTGRITKARPKTAAYPFTTLHPQIGVIEYLDEVKGNRRLLLADVPGLIEGAHENRGLGHRFLRHIERCALLIFLIDMAAHGRARSA